MEYLKQREIVESWINHYVKLDDAIDMGGYKRLVIKINSIPSWYIQGKDEFDMIRCSGPYSGRARLVTEYERNSLVMYEHFVDYMYSLFKCNNCKLWSYKFDTKSEYPDCFYGLIKVTTRTLTIDFRER